MTKQYRFFILFFLFNQPSQTNPVWLSFFSQQAKEEAVKEKKMEKFNVDDSLLLLHAMELQPKVTLEFIHQEVLPRIIGDLYYEMNDDAFRKCTREFRKICQEQLKIDVDMDYLLNESYQDITNAINNGWEILPYTSDFAGLEFPETLKGKMRDQAPLYVCFKGDIRMLDRGPIMIQHTEFDPKSNQDKQKTEFQKMIQNAFASQQEELKQNLLVTIIDPSESSQNEAAKTVLRGRMEWIGVSSGTPQETERFVSDDLLRNWNAVVVSTSLRSAPQSAADRFKAELSANKIAAAISSGIVMTGYTQDFYEGKDSARYLSRDARFLQYAMTLQVPILINNMTDAPLNLFSRNAVVINGQRFNPSAALDLTSRFLIQSRQAYNIEPRISGLEQVFKNDFVLAKFIGFYNEHFDYNDNINRISTKMAHAWRKEISRQWNQKNPSEDWRLADVNSAMSFARNVLNDLLEKHPYPLPVLPEEAKKTAEKKEAALAYDFQEAASEFDDLTSRSILPVTGINPWFRNREIANSLGNNIGYLSETEMREAGIYRLAEYDGSLLVKRIRKKGTASNYYDQVGSLTVYRTEDCLPKGAYGQLLTQNDLYGIVDLIRRADPEISRGNPVQQFAQKLPNFFNMAPGQASLALREIRHCAGLGSYMLKWMDARGLMYTVSFNSTMESLCAEIAGTKTTVDIMRLPDSNPEYIGTIRGDGIERHISVNFATSDKKNLRYLPTEQQLALNLAHEFFPSRFNAIRNKVLNKAELERFPEPGVYNLNFSDPQSKSDAYYTKESHVLKFGFASYPVFDLSRPIESSGLIAEKQIVQNPATRKTYSASIYTTFQRGNIINLISPSEGAAFTEQCIEEARKNFISEVNLNGPDGIVNAWQKAQYAISQESDLSESQIKDIYDVLQPEWSSEEICADTQKAIWNSMTTQKGRDSVSIRNARVSDDSSHEIVETDPIILSVSECQNPEIFIEKVSKAYFGDFELSDLNPQRKEDPSYHPAFSGKFDITRVVSFMSSTSERQNKSNLIKALQVWNPEGLSEIINCHEYSAQQAADSLISFDENSAFSIRNITNPGTRIESFVSKIGEMVEDSMKKSTIDMGAQDDIQMDKNGVIRFTGTLHISEGHPRAQNKNQDPKTAEQNAWKNLQLRRGIPVEGIIGQIFIPDEIDDCGGVMLKTKFAKSKNQIRYLNKTLTVAPKKDPFSRFNLDERIYATTYTTVIEQAIYKTIPKIAIDARSQLEYAAGFASRHDPREMIRQKIGSPTILNETLYIGNRVPCVRQPLNQHSIDEKNQTSMAHIQCRHEINMRQATFALPLHGQDFFLQVKNQQTGKDITNDLVRSYLDELDWMPINVMGQNRDRIIDPNYTANNDKQGIKVMLKNNARIIEGDGHIGRNPAISEAAPYEELMPFNKHDAGNRITMSLINLQNATKVTTSKIAYTCAGGYNLEDAIVVSKEFAEKNAVMNHDGVLRPLGIDDKLSDTHGNKGVISLVVDRNMSMSAAEKLGIEQLVQLYKDNPELDLVMSPFPALSRSNGGLGVEGFQHNQDLIVNGEVIEGGMIEVVTIITDKLGEDKTTTYDENEGRKISEEIITALATKGEGKIVRSAFRKNSQAIRNLREYLILTGMDIDPLTRLQVGYHANPGEERFICPRISSFIVSETGVAETKQVKADDRKFLIYKANRKECARIFNHEFSDSGGFLETDFELRFPYPNNNPIPPIVVESDGSKHPAQTDEEWQSFGYRKDSKGIWWRSEADRQRMLKDRSIPASRKFPTYALPVLEPALRKERTEDGILHHSDLTAKYIKIVEKNAELRASVDASFYKKVKNGPARYQADFQRLQKEAQSSFAEITGPVIDKFLSGKHNIFKKALLMNSFENSATAVMHSNSRLGCNELEVSPTVFESMNLNPDEENWILMFRNPVLTNGGIRYVKVVMKPDIQGAGMAPHTCKSFEGDFDGDTFGLVNITDPAARLEAQETLVWANNLLNLNDTEKNLTDPQAPGAEIHPIWLHTCSDVAVAMHYIPDLADEWNTLTLDANQVWRRFRMTSDHETYLEENEEIISRLDAFYAKAYELSFGMATVSYASPEAHYASILEGSVFTGAKGDPKKLQEYAKQIGHVIDYDYDAEGNVTGIKSVREITEIHSEQEQEILLRTGKQGVSVASGIKAKGPGLAGKEKQFEYALNKGRQVNYGTSAENLDIAISLAGLGTQRLLQAKKDPDGALRIFEILHDPCHTLLNDGKPIEYCPPQYNEFGAMTYPGGWKTRQPMKGEDEVQVWIDSAYHFITSKEGMNCAFSMEALNAYARNMTVSDEYGNKKIVGLRNESYLENNGELLNELVAAANYETIVEAARDGRFLVSTEPSADLFPFLKKVQELTRNTHEILENKPDLPLCAAVESAREQMGNVTPSPAWTNRKVQGSYGKHGTDAMKEQKAALLSLKLDELKNNLRTPQAEPQKENEYASNPELIENPGFSVNGFDLRNDFYDYQEDDSVFEF